MIPLQILYIITCLCLFVTSSVLQLRGLAEKNVTAASCESTFNNFQICLTDEKTVVPDSEFHNCSSSFNEWVRCEEPSSHLSAIQVQGSCKSCGDTSGNCGQCATSVTVKSSYCNYHGDQVVKIYKWDYGSCSDCGRRIDQGTCTCYGGWIGAFCDQPCSPGTYSNAGDKTCTQCPANTFARLPGSSSCNSCPNGKTSTSGSATCTGSTNDIDGTGYAYVCEKGDDDLEKVCLADGNCFPGLDVIGKLVWSDKMTGTFGTSAFSNFRAFTFSDVSKSASLKQYTYHAPTAVSVTQRDMTSYTTDSVKYSSIKDFQKSLSFDLGLDSNAFKFGSKSKSMSSSLGLSTSYGKDIIKKTSYNYYQFRSELTQLLASLSIITNYNYGLSCSSSFYNDLKSIPDNANTQRIVSFIEKWGDSVVIGADVGAALSYDVTYDACSFSSESEVSQGVSLFGSYATSISLGTSSSYFTYKSLTTTHTSAKVYGCDTSLYASSTLSNPYQSWLNSCSKPSPLLAPISLQIIPIYALVESGTALRSLFEAGFTTYHQQLQAAANIDPAEEKSADVCDCTIKGKSICSGSLPGISMYNSIVLAVIVIASLMTSSS